MICLPLVTALIGWITNVIAVKMLFHPRKPISLFGFKMQGLIPRRQQALAGSLADLFTQELVSDKDLMDRFGAAEPILDQRLDNFVGSVKKQIPMAGLLLSDSLVATMREELKQEILSSLPDLGHHLDLRGLVEEKIASFPISQLEGVATRELRMIGLWGAVVGFILGLVPLAVMMI